MSSYIFGDVIFDDRTGEPLRKAVDSPLADRTWAKCHPGLEKSAADAARRPVISLEEFDRNVAIARLEKAASDWLSVADDRTSGLDPEVRSFYRSKAAKATAEAAKLSGAEPAKPKADPVKATRLEQEAAHHDQLATGSTDPGVRRYHRMMARDKRDAAAAERGDVLIADSTGLHRETR